MEIFYQVFDKGMLEDGEGREIDFKNTIILLTSNVGTDTIMKLCADPETAPEPEALAEALRPELLKVFKPALLGRMIVVPYYPLADESCGEIIKLQLGRIGEPPAREPRRRVHLRRRRSSSEIAEPLQGGGERRPQRRPHPDRARCCRRCPASSSRAWPRAADEVHVRSRRRPYE